jgi:hypothetical protein
LCILSTKAKRKSRQADKIERIPPGAQSKTAAAAGADRQDARTQPLKKEFDQRNVLLVLLLLLVILLGPRRPSGLGWTKTNRVFLVAVP